MYEQALNSAEFALDPPPRRPPTRQELCDVRNTRDADRFAPCMPLTCGFRCRWGAV